MYWQTDTQVQFGTDGFMDGFLTLTGFGRDDHSERHGLPDAKALA
jgi:hypothetical protein